MVQMTTAIYEKGTLRLLGPLALPEHTQVRVQVEVVETLSPVEELERACEALRQAGLLAEPPDEIVYPVPEEERARLARKLAEAGPLSEVIIEDRDSC